VIDVFAPPRADWDQAELDEAAARRWP
jgi:hypothetical protein